MWCSTVYTCVMKFLKLTSVRIFPPTWSENHYRTSIFPRDCVDTQRIVCSRQIELRPSETAITISTSHPFRCLWLTREKDLCHQYQRESIDSLCNFVYSNLNYCLKHSSLGPPSQPTALIKPTTTAVHNFPQREQILVLLRLRCTSARAVVTC